MTNLPSSPAIAPTKPSPWLLNDEPDLTPDQVWMVLASAGQGGLKVLREGVAIADTAEQAAKGIEQSRWTPLVLVNETALDAQISVAEKAPTYVVRNVFGHAGTHRFACVFATNDDQRPMRLVWVLAPNENAARHAWRHLGETEEPTAVFKLSDLVASRDKVRDVRLHRGDGAMTDGRDFSNWRERWRGLEEQNRPGGRAEFEADMKELDAIRMRVQTKRLAAKGER
ncbi:hypothetical protein [Rhodanobacter denitrificans]|uniref:hypothetical protein n=1 Tax=Rhodanobacter denitrificans TaxID=666685 RepID=UPI0012FE4DE9|nr:hypothetical protein [Rhodanobacter denitrificans]UJM85507.1 hypothetical protein LRJ86_12050 [Rhodanobacter denitrificans]